MGAGFFVTGTDTGVGKTFVSCLLLKALAKQRKTVVGMKPIAAGHEKGQWLDVELLRAASNVDIDADLTNPYALDSPIAPHIAARQQAIEIDLKKINKAFQEINAKADYVVVEGVGGFLVPLNETQDTSDLARLLNLPVILVVGMRLGCINHALLTIQAIQRVGLLPSGWVANCIDSDFLALEENIDSLKQRLVCPLLGIVPFDADSDLGELSRLIDISSLL